jgi:hypothetical protein
MLLVAIWLLAVVYVAELDVGMVALGVAPATAPCVSDRRLPKASYAQPVCIPA